MTHLRESHPIPVLETVPRLVQTRNHSLGILRDSRHHRRNGLNPVGIVDREFLTEIAKDLREESSRLGDDQRNPVPMGELGDATLLGRQRIGQDDDAELGEEVLGQLLGVDARGNVVVEIGQLDARDFGSVPAHIALRQIELGGQILERCVDGVVQRHRFDAAQNHVLGHLDAQTAQTADQHVGGGHATHRIVAQDVQLTRVETLVDVADGRSRSVRSVSGSSRCGR